MSQRYEKISIFATVKGNNNKKMENNNEEVLFKSRSSQSCIRFGYKLYLSNFRKIFKAAWIPALLYAVCFSAVMTVGVIHYPRLNISVVANPQLLMSVLDSYKLIFSIFVIAVILGAVAEILFYASGFRLLAEHKDTGTISRPAKWLQFDKKSSWRAAKGILASLLVVIVLTAIAAGIGDAIALVANKAAGKVMIPPMLMVLPLMLIAVLLSLPVIYALYKYIFTPEAKYWNQLWQTYKDGMRHWGQLFATAFIGVLVILLISTVILLPANILSLANYEANLGILYGDPLGMPSYIVPLTAFIMLIAGFVEAFIRLTIYFIMYYVFGSIEGQEKERREFRNTQMKNRELDLKLNFDTKAYLR